MPKATKEFILNYATNRWQLNFKRNVGPTSESIRTAKPKSRAEWEKYYYANVRSRAQIDSLGEKLFQEVTTTLPDEERFHPALIASVTRKDCVAYMHNLVIDRTYDGYAREIG